MVTGTKEKMARELLNKLQNTIGLTMPFTEVKWLPLIHGLRLSFNAVQEIYHANYVDKATQCENIHGDMSKD